MTMTEKETLIDEIMGLAMRLDRLDAKYQLRPDKKPVIEFYFDNIPDLFSVEGKLLHSMSKTGFMRGIDWEQVTGRSEFSDCRDYDIGPIKLRLRCDKLLDAPGARRGVRDISVVYPRPM